jgi:hypothetical protein
MEFSLPVGRLGNRICRSRSVIRQELNFEDPKALAAWLSVRYKLVLSSTYSRSLRRARRIMHYDFGVNFPNSRRNDIPQTYSQN